MVDQSLLKVLSNFTCSRELSLHGALSTLSSISTGCQHMVLCYWWFFAVVWVNVPWLEWMSPLLRDLAAQAPVCPDNPCGQQPQNSGWAGKDPFIPPWEACFPSLHLFLSFLLEICVICTIRQYLKFWKAQCLNKQKVPQNKPKKSLQRDTSSIRSRPLKHIFFRSFKWSYGPDGEKSTKPSVG